jgi:hypothetical protein
MRGGPLGNLPDPKPRRLSKGTPTFANLGPAIGPLLEKQHTVTCHGQPEQRVDLDTSAGQQQGDNEPLENPMSLAP